MSRSEAETMAVGRALAAELVPDGALLLSGRLGAGKTVLAKGVAAALGIEPAQIQSPTFTLMREHHGPGGRLLHIDLYRLEPTEVTRLGLEEALAGPGVKVVEWSERLPALPAGALRLELRSGGPANERLVVELAGIENPVGERLE
ncbi:MAG: tRNA (adenosine(37)-N6)-threonylcarbamoyltransferase complex ATPase subunit type 1 TsaE [Thermoanaerobaculia bacterium]